MFRLEQAYPLRTIAAYNPTHGSDQLTLRATPQLRSLGEQVAHIIAVRARWLFLVLGLLADGYPLQAIVHVFQLDERTVAAWRDRAGQQCQRLQHAVVQQGKLSLTHVQTDEIRIKGKRGILWMGLVMEVSSRLWLAGVVQHTRDRILADRFLRMVRRCASEASQLLICVDGWSAYPNAILRAFTQQVKEGLLEDRAQIQVWPQLIIGQVIKTQKKYRLISVQLSLLCGTEQGLAACLTQSKGGMQINTAYIERFNGTIRERLASLMRECRHASAHLVGNVPDWLYLQFVLDT